MLAVLFLKALGKNLYHAFHLASGVASHPWCSLVYSLSLQTLPLSYSASIFISHSPCVPSHLPPLEPVFPHGILVSVSVSDISWCPNQLDHTTTVWPHCNLHLNYICEVTVSTWGHIHIFQGLKFEYIFFKRQFNPQHNTYTHHL